MQEVYIAAAVRTPIGSFGGQFAGISATELGAAAIRGALDNANIPPQEVEEVLMGNVCSANVGQAPARQAALGAGIGENTPCTTINKVCASGMKSVLFGAQSIALGQNQIVVAGGMESMSNIPYYVPSARWGSKYGNRELVDGLSRDGLTDPWEQQAMGVYADRTAARYGIPREAQDAFAERSYRLVAEHTAQKAFSPEIVPVSVPQRKGEPLLIAEDEEYQRVDFAKIPTLRPAFSKDGTVTAANASTMNDGAAALVLVGKTQMEALGLVPIARIASYADAEQAPAWFTTAPILAAPKALERAGLRVEDIDYFEVNEAFAVVPMVFCKELGIPLEKMNVRGGACALGHPLGASGARILVTLLHILQQKGGRYGLAAICNGGGGASAIVVERL
jgi:acetyl-CoA C-acetyltransferase